MARRLKVFSDGTIGFEEPIPGDSQSERLERKRIAARCGHVKRQLTQNRPLTGKVLKFALSVLAEKGLNSDDRQENLASKLAKGKQLDEYELHLMVDVYLLHYRLGVSR